MIVSIARVVTDTPSRYAKQLVAHLGRKVPTEELPDGGRRLTLSAGTGVVTPVDGALVMVATAADEQGLAAVQDVLTRHLERFGARRHLTVQWALTSDPGMDMDG